MTLRSPCLVISRAATLRVRRLLAPLSRLAAPRLRLIGRYLSGKPSGRVASIACRLISRLGTLYSRPTAVEANNRANQYNKGAKE